MRSRAKIIVKGDVQETGYRALVRKIARKLKLVGFVENLPDGRVRIVCEGEKEAIEDLCKRIRIKDGFITVTSVRKRSSEPKGEFRSFVVKTEDLVSEMFQGYATAGKYFRNLGSKVNGVGEKVESVDEGIKSMHKDVNRQFDKLDGYGKVASKMDLLDIHIKEIRDDFRLLVDHVVGRERKSVRN
jgi:acylphosphatase